MQSQFAARAMPLGHLLANLHIIKTPPYQRSFAWEQREACRLLEDLTDALDAVEQGEELDDYFLGTMLFIEVEKVTKRSSALPFSRQTRQLHLLEVVDGLQRLTTLTILFCVICAISMPPTASNPASACWLPSVPGREHPLIACHCANLTKRSMCRRVGTFEITSKPTKIASTSTVSSMMNWLGI